MPGTTTPQLRVARPGSQRGGWYHLGWKIILAALLFAFMSVGLTLRAEVVFALIPLTLFVWGTILAAIAMSNLFNGPEWLRWAWVAMAVGAYGALALPGMFVGASRIVDAVGPVAALTLAAHLGRRDLRAALSDWASALGVALYAALGMLAMWLLIYTFGLLAFAVGALFPPLVFEAVMLLARRVERRGESAALRLGALGLATLLAIVAFASTLLNRSTPTVWLVVFALIIGLLIGGGLLISLLTRPLIEAASGASGAHRSASDALGNRLSLSRALVELSHGPILIALVLYLPLRALGTSLPGG